MLYYLLIFILIVIFIFIIFKNIKKSNNKKINKENKENKENTKVETIYKKQCKIKIKKKGENKEDNKTKNTKSKNNKKHIINHIKKLQRKHKKLDKIQKKSNEVYLIVEMNGEEMGKLKIRLFDNIVPKTCENFRQLCKTKKYIYSPFHRIIKDFMIQGGDFTSYDGTGGESIYGGKFPDENFQLKHDKPYLLSMANAGPNTNRSQFFITTSETPHLDGKHVVFGEIIEGFDIIYELNNLDTDNKDRPINKIVISECGICN
jgi:cyclophilin family peptidyl-prolyl cis-trans isomerase